MKKILSVTVVILVIIISASASAKSIGIFTAISGTVEVQGFYDDLSRQVKIGAIVNVSDVVYTFDIGKRR